MTITIKQLQHVIAIVEHDGYRNAAKANYITQAGVSNSIKTLENIIGEKIFKPTHKTTLTPYGKIVLPWIRDFVRHYERLNNSLIELADGNVGDLKVCCQTSILNDCMPTILNDFKSKYNNVNISLSESNITRIHERVLDNEIDIGICSRVHGLSDKVEFMNLYKDRLGVIVSQDHPLAGQDMISLQDIHAYDFISNGLTINLANDMDSITPFNQRAVQHVDSLLSLIVSVEMGMGVSIASGGKTIKSMNNKVTWIPLEAPVYFRQVGVLFHKNSINHPTIPLFVDSCLRFIKLQSQIDN